MRKSVLAMVAAAAIGAMGAADASVFSITGAGTGGSGPVSAFTMNSNLVSNVITATGATDITTAGSGVRSLNIGARNNILSLINGAVGSQLTAPRLTYFTMHTGTPDQGYFGVVFQNDNAVKKWTVNIGNASIATRGVFVYEGQSSIGADGVFSSELTLGGGVTTYVAIFAGINIGTSLGDFNLSYDDENFDVRYLDFSSGSYGVLQSQSVLGVKSSQINAAMYAVPVPAPMLLAGAGLIGAAVLRRRMVSTA